MEIRKTEYMVSSSGGSTANRVDGIVQQIYYTCPDDCDGHETNFAYDYTGEETAHKFPWTHSKEVESWRIGAGAFLCEITKQEGNHVEYACKLNEAAQKSRNCTPGEDGTIPHGNIGVRLVLYATMKIKEAPKPAEPTPEPETPSKPAPEPEPEAPKEEATQVASKRSRIYHEGCCFSVDRIHPKNLTTDIGKRRHCKHCQQVRA